MKRKIVKAATTVAMPMLRSSASAGIAALTAGRLGRRKRPSMGRTAMKGLGAAAVALPFGMWMGRKMMGQTEGERR